jgi:hypothetical protein
LIGAALQLVHVKPPVEAVPIEMADQQKKEKEPEQSPSRSPKPRRQPARGPSPRPTRCRSAPPTFSFVVGASTDSRIVATEPKVVRQSTLAHARRGTNPRPDAGRHRRKRRRCRYHTPRTPTPRARRSRKVRVQLTIDATGMTDGVVEGLGSASTTAVEALKSAKFAPATVREARRDLRRRRQFAL